MLNFRPFLCAVSFVLLTFVPSVAQTPVTCGQELDAPGLYVLTGDLGCGISIFIKSDNVTLDLQGHTLSNTSGNPITGIITGQRYGAPTQVTTRGTRILNGTITGFGTAIALGGPVGPAIPRTTDAQIHHVSATGNQRGILVGYASGVMIHNNVITDNARLDPGDDSLPYGFGIAAFDLIDSQIKNNVVTGNSSDGIALRAKSSDNTLMKNTASSNGRYGILLSTFGGPSTDNVIKNNDALSNATLDLMDQNPSCDDNIWKKNTFETSDPAACIF